MSLWCYCEDHWKLVSEKEWVILPKGVLVCDYVIGYYTNNDGERKPQRCIKPAIYGIHIISD